jgi:hypothetical protein
VPKSCWGYTFGDNTKISMQKETGLSIPFLLEANDYIETNRNLAVSNLTIRILVIRTRESTLSSITYRIMN